jgi:TRAP-type C4-dicarboxylate transport system permease small subunit
MNSLISAVRKADRIVASALKAVTIACFAVLLVILSLNILNRFIPVTSFHWLDEIIELCFAGLVFYGAAAVWAARGHFSAGDWISARLGSPRLVEAYRLFVEVCGLVFVGVLLKYSFDLTAKSQEATAVFQIPKAVLYSCMPVSAALMALYSLVRIGAAVARLAKGAGDDGRKQ